MIRVRFAWSRSLAMGLLLTAAAPLAAEDKEAPGVVRISNGNSATIRAQSEGVSPANCQQAPMQPAFGCPTGNCPTDGYVVGAYPGTPYRCDWRTADWSCRPFHQRTQAHSLAVECWLAEHCCCFCNKTPCVYYHDCTGQDMLAYFRCKFGYFIPTGNGGAGTPPIGHYSRVYPADPSYFDQRDGQLWGAQGYGTAVAVPLAPVVAHQYNYSWGTPASRLTPVSRIAPY